MSEAPMRFEIAATRHKVDTWGFVPKGSLSGEIPRTSYVRADLHKAAVDGLREARMVALRLYGKQGGKVLAERIEGALIDAGETV